MAGTDLDDADKPLDPATERLRRKMVRLLAVSIGIMMVAVMAVLAAVVYKINRDTAPREAAAPIDIVLPAGAVIEDTALSGDEALLRLRVGEAEQMLRIDLPSGRVVARYDIRRQ